MKRPVRRRDDTEIGHLAILDPEPVHERAARRLGRADAFTARRVIGPGLQHDPSPPERLDVAPGLEADRALFEACERQRAAREVIVIGDNFHIGRVFEAVQAGFTVGNAL